MDERLVSTGLLSAIGKCRWRDAKSTGSGCAVRPFGTERAEENTSRRLVFVHRSVLFALHGGHAGKGRGQHGYESPRISLRERRVAAHLSLIRSLGRTPKARYYASQPSARDPTPTIPQQN